MADTERNQARAGTAEVEMERRRRCVRRFRTPQGAFDRLEKGPGTAESALANPVATDVDTDERERFEVLPDLAVDEERIAYLDEESALDLVTADTNADVVMDYIDDFTSDEEIEEDFDERQRMSRGGEDLVRRLRQHHAHTPELTAGDVDAAWEDAGVGDETVGGTAPTPDQDIVDQIGRAVGITYEDGEPLRTGEILEERDQRRWELDPESAEDEDEEGDEEMWAE